jgi:hypothetical protein
MSLLTHRRNDYSQNGEDGILEHVFSVLGTTRGTFVEFGAWDGIHFANCRRLWEQGWSGVFIEADDQRYFDLLLNYAASDRVRCVRRLVQPTGPDSLDAILDEFLAGQQLDLCCIDVDGLDYNIFAGLERHRPTVICVEVNAGFHPLVREQIPDEVAAHNIGQSLWTMTEMARGKGYEILCYTGNAIFVRQEHVAGFDTSRDLTALWQDFYGSLDPEAQAWLRGVNAGINPPHFRFHNPLIV